MTNVQNMHCCASSTVVLPLVFHAALYLSMNADQECKTRKLHGFFFSLELCVHRT